MSDSEQEPISDPEMLKARAALRQLRDASREAIAFFEHGLYDAAQLEVDRARSAMRRLDNIRREQKRRMRDDDVCG